MEGIKKGFYTTSLKNERKPEVDLGQSSLTQPQPFSQQSQQSGIQQNYKERKQTQKSTHVLTPMSEQKPRKQAKSALQQEVSELNPSGLMNMEKLSKVVLNLQEEVKKLRKDNEKQLQQLNLAEGIESRLMSQERELSAFWNISQSQNIQSQNQLQKQTELDNRLGKIEENCKFLRKSKAKLELYKQKLKSKKANTTRKIIKNQKEMFLMQKHLTSLSEVLEILIEIKKLLDKRTTKEEKRRKKKKKEEA